MGILLGLIAALCWGVSDFAARFAARRVGAYRALFIMQAVGFLLLTGFLESAGGITRSVAPGARPWLLAGAIGVLNVFASLALYRSFAIGTMSIVAPISSSYPAITVALSILSGERLQAFRAAGLGATFIGVILAAMSFAPRSHASGDSAAGVPAAHLSSGVGLAIVSACGFGVMFWFLGFHVMPLMGSAVSVWVLRLTGFGVLALAAWPARQSVRLPRGSVWWILLLIGVADTSAFVANNAGLQLGSVSVVSVLASLYGAVTVLLSWIFLRERLGRSQWLGIALIFAGVVLVSI
ncbi:MAG TPA: EamA family transporter [Candidatus Acidoferrales bacterium]|nr:EamA family transporter [Candidatus Acidoferrales bacterium]